MKQLAFILAFGMVSLAIAETPTLAQRQTTGMGFRLGQEVRDHRRARADTPAQGVMMMTAECLVDRREKNVREYLKAVPASEAEDSAYESLSDHVTRCMPDMAFENVGNAQNARGELKLSFDHSTLRGALAEALVRKDRSLISVPESLLGDEGMYAAEHFHGQQSSDPRRVFALGFAGCVMGHNPTKLESVFSTDPGTIEEQRAVMTLSGSFADCVMEGQTLSIDAAILRNQLAEVAYYAIANENR